VTTEDDFQAALDADPEDWQTRLVFADWLQEHSDSRAEGYRALGMLQKHPRPDKQEYEVNRRFLTWFLLEKQNATKYHPNSLTRDWFVLIEGGEQLSDEGVAVGADEDSWSIRGDWLDWPTRREAEDGAALAFAKLPPARRAELLTGSTDHPPTTAKKPAKPKTKKRKK
jgi:uncharacterized protein (TIGR02996 family)